MSEKISVVIPTYSRMGEKLEVAINSVVNQTYRNVEIIVVDDNSDPAYSEDIVRTLQRYPNIKYIKHDYNKGACQARNTGILNSSGEYVAFLDDDDNWNIDKLEKQMLKFYSSNTGLVYCGIKYYYEKKRKYVLRPAQRKNDVCRELLIWNYIGSTSCGMVRKDAALEVGMFDMTLKSGQDLDFWYRIAEKYDVECVDECLLNYTIYSDGTITSNYKNRLESNLYLKSKYNSRIINDIELLNIYNIKIVMAYWKCKMIKQGVRFIIDCQKEWNIIIIVKSASKYACLYLKNKTLK